MSRARGVILTLGASWYISHAPLHLSASATPVLYSSTTLLTHTPSPPWVWIPCSSFTPGLCLVDSSHFSRNSSKVPALRSTSLGELPFITVLRLSACCIFPSCSAEHTLKVACVLLSSLLDSKIFEAGTVFYLSFIYYTPVWPSAGA